MQTICREMTDKYQLLSVTELHLPTIYQWTHDEKHLEYYTCRPVQRSESLEDYTVKTLASIAEGKRLMYVLVHVDEPQTLLGRTTLFDINPRNHSAEFGYYLPEYNRGKGLGSVMLEKLLQISCEDKNLALHKLYATTSSNNHPSVKLLERYKFQLEGRLREHYWIEDQRYDQLIYSLLLHE
ncbi:MAG: acetyltransferase [Herbinix sp.]|nr:acetyltransferase [Herbinix sp.]